MNLLIKLIKNNLLLNIRTGFPHPVVVSNLFLGDDKDTLLFECGVQSQDSHEDKVGWHADYED